MVERLPPDVEAKYNKYMQLRETLNAISQERVVLEGSIAEIDAIIEKIKEAGDDAELYKMAGFILVKSSKEAVLKELEEKRENLEVRLRAVKSQEESMTSELRRLEEEIKKALGGKPAGGAG